MGTGVCSAQSHSAYQVSEGNENKDVLSGRLRADPTQQNSESYFGKQFLYNSLWLFNLILSQPELEEENY